MGECRLPPAPCPVSTEGCGPRDRHWQETPRQAVCGILALVLPEACSRQTPRGARDTLKELTF